MNHTEYMAVLQSGVNINQQTPARCEMSAVPLREVVDALRGVFIWDDAIALADRVEKHGIAQPDGRTPVAWAVDTEFGRGYVFAEELLNAFPSFPNPEPAGSTPPHTCKFCGAPSWLDPSEQDPPPDYCHESDHGEPETTA